MIDKLTLLFVRAIGTLFQLFINILIGRVAGAESLGSFNVFMAWSNFFSVISSFGMNTFIVKSVAGGEAGGNSLKTGVIICSCVFLFFCCLYWFFGGYSSALMYLLAGYLVGLLKLRSDYFKGKFKPIASVLLEFVLVQLCFVFIILWLYYLNVEGLEYPQIYLLCISVVFLCVLFHSYREFLFGKIVNVNFTKLSSFWFVLVLNSYVAALPYILLPEFVGSADVGVFAVVHKVVAVAGTITLTLGAYYAPYFSKHWSNKDLGSLKGVFRNSRWFSFLCILPLFLICILCGDLLLSVFGDGFSSGNEMLVVLIFGRLASSVFGPVEHLMTMIDGQIIERNVSASLAVLMTFVSFVVVPDYGVFGFSIVYAVFMFLRPAMSFFILQRLLSVRSYE